LLNEVEEVSEEWLSLPGRRERGFTLGSFDRGYLRETPLFVLRDPGERALAFANEVPSYRKGEATIDMMRHRLEMPNGTMDYLLTKLMLDLREKGHDRFDLGLAPLAGIGDRPGAPLEERTLNQLSERLTRFFSYKGLRFYKAKFDPDWEERFLAYRGGPAGLARVGLALTRVTEER
jgi:phosphatidylglycerol lysyltransferase